MSDLAAYLGLYVKGDAAQKVAELDKGFERLAVRGERHMGALGRSMGVAGQAVDKLSNRYTALLSGAAGIGAGKMVGDLNTEMMKLKLNAGASAETMAAFKQRMFEVARLPHVSMDPSELLAAVAEVVERTGDLKYAVDNIEGIGIAARATFSGGAEIGGMAAELTKFGAAVNESFAIIKAQGDNGAFTLGKMAEHGPEMMSAYATMGRKGLDAVREFGAMAQIAMDATGKADVAKSSVVTLINELQDVEKQKKLKSHGIQLFDPAELAKGRKIYRALPDIVRDVIVAAKGDGSKIGTVFGSEAMRAMNSAITDYQDDGKFDKSLDKFMRVDADPAGLLKQAAEAGTSFGAAMSRLNGEWKVFADTNLAEPVAELASQISQLQPERVQATMKALAWGAGAIGGVIALKKGVDAARWTADTLTYIRGPKGAKGGIAGATASAAGAVGGGAPIPVIVTNWPGGMGGSSGGLADLAGDVGGKGGKATAAKGAKGMIGRLASRGAGLTGGLLRRAGPLAAIGMGAYETIDAMMSGDTRAALGAAGRAVGGGLGGIGGGALGSVAMPGVGTVAGGLIGATAGAAGGEVLLTKLYDWLTGAQAQQTTEPTKVESTVALRLELPPGVSAHATNLTASAGLDVDMGYNF